ncbi:MAG TPA: universal stress protein [Albitalea sp.]|nr:universal stress protein [Albitalea sp.]
MNAIKSILLHLDATPGSATRLWVARELARQHEATVTALYAVTSSFAELPFALAADVPATQILQDIDADRLSRARAMFDKGTAKAGAPVAWAELGGAPVIPGFIEQALCADLLVLGQREPEGPMATDVPADFVESVLVGSGRPAFIVPYAGEIESIGGNALVAWNATRESAHALSAALPLLRDARQVEVVSWAEEAASPRGATLDVKRYLQLHGIKAAVHQHEAAPSEIGESLLSLASDFNSDFLVMGCYGHSRARELVLGGATRTVLRSMTLPVLMAH